MSAESPGGSEAELRALVGLATAVVAAERPEVVLDVAADACVGSLGVAAVSVSRWRPESRCLQVIVNAGWLAPGEERHPEDELWPVDEYPLVRRLVEERQPYLVDAADPEPGPEHEALRKLGGGTALGLPIELGSAVWGELEVFTAAGTPPLTGAQLPFFQAVVVQIAAALGRAQHFARLATMAFEDPLTGLPNRRAVEERLSAAVAHAAPDHPVTLMFSDLDGLKDINDHRGHAAGDQALRDVGAALAAAAAGIPDAMAARLGGDEFCVLLDGHDAERARDLSREVRLALRRRRPPLALSSGVVACTAPPERVADVLRAADAAQYAAKRAGGGRLYVAEAAGQRPPEPPRPAAPPARRQLRDAPHVDRAALTTDVLAVLDGAQAAAGPAERLEAVGAACAVAAGFAAWTVLHAAPGEGDLRTVLFGARRAGDAPELRFRTPQARIPIPLLPGAAEALRGGGFTLSLDAPEADPRALDILREGGWVAAIGAGATAAAGDGYLVVLLADDAGAELAAISPEVRLFVREAVHGAPAAA